MKLGKMAIALLGIAALLAVLAPTSNAVAGRAAVLVIAGCTMPINPGWNLISVCANATNSSVASTLQSINGQYRYVLRWNNSAEKFNIYSPSAAANPFDEMLYNESYFVYYTGASPAYAWIIGNPLASFNATLAYGWNALGYPFQITANVTRYFNSTQHRYMVKWNASGQSFEIYSPRSLVQPFGTITLGEGQFIHCAQPAGCPIMYNTTLLQS